MKKILILAYDFPPYVSVGGLRPYSWYKYFHEFGLYPVVVTRQWGNKYGNHLDYIAPGESTETIIEETEFGTIIRTPYKPNLANRIMLKYGDSKFGFIRKAITAYYEFAQFLFFVGTKSGLYFGAKKYLKENRVDCIIATGEPFVLFKYASKLNSKFNIPWIADYRDPWTQSSARSKNFLYKAFNSCIEKQILKSVSKITTVSDFLKSKIETLVKDKEFQRISNGYDSSLVQNISIIDQSADILTIGFVGTIYPWHPMKSILEVFSEVIQLGLEIKLEFYGVNIENSIKDSIENDYPILKDNVVVIPRIPNEELLKRLAKSNALLLVNDYSIMGTKIFDYLGVQRKIIFCYSDDEESRKLKELHYSIEENNLYSQSLQEDLIIETNSGIIVKDKDHLKEVLINLHKEFNEKGFIACESFGFEKYSRREQVKELARVIGGVTG